MVLPPFKVNATGLVSPLIVRSPLTSYPPSTGFTDVLLKLIDAYWRALKYSGLFRCVSRPELFVSTLCDLMLRLKELLAASLESRRNEPAKLLNRPCT